MSPVECRVCACGAKNGGKKSTRNSIVGNSAAFKTGLIFMYTDCCEILRLRLMDCINRIILQTFMDSLRQISLLIIVKQNIRVYANSVITDWCRATGHLLYIQTLNRMHSN